MDPQQQQQHQQEMSSNSNTLENMLGCSRTDKKAKPALEHALECPRCESTNTKFCYYNNYSLSQPRYFCKSCRRYWTKGGTLRNVPVGGGCRKNKRSSSSSSSSSKRSQSQDHQPLLITSNQNPLLSYDSNDLTLAFARLQKQHQQQQSGGHNLGFDHHDQFSNMTAQGGSSFLDALRCGYQNQNNPNFQNLYYGYGGNGEVEDGSGDVSGEMVLPYASQEATNATTTAVTVTTMKQEMCNGIGDHSYRDQAASDQNKMLWGLPWQINGSDHHHQATNNININMADLDSGRESWTGFAPSWHGLLNSPLM